MIFDVVVGFDYRLCLRFRKIIENIVGSVPVGAPKPTEIIKIYEINWFLYNWKTQNIKKHQTYIFHEHIIWQYFTPLSLVHHAEEKVA